MKVAVYDRYWATAGGGERFAAGIAEALVPDHDVVLLAHAPIDTVALGERLHTDLSGVDVVVIDETTGAVEAASGDYDLFVNASYTSRVVNHARHGIYVVHFPGPATTPPWPIRSLLGLAARLVGRGSTTVRYGAGFHAPEWLLQRQGAWTEGRAELLLTLPAGRHDVTLELARLVPPGGDTVTATVSVGGESVAEEVVTSRRSRRQRRTVLLGFGIDSTGGDRPVPVIITTDRVGDAGGRPLGTAVVGVRVGSGLRARVRGWFPLLAGGASFAGFTASYDRIVANSEFTRHHVRAQWGCESSVLHPPVTMHEPAAAKLPRIVTVGRFFPAETGHSKKQLEMVRAFRRLVDQGVGDWELHLVGGVDADGAAYLAAVEAEAAGLPVRVSANATGAALAAAYGEASIYWHAAGLGEDPERHPDRLEHFGITTVEAMSAGAVPVVFAAAGQLETVDDGVTGLHWRTVDELVEKTRSLIEDPDRRARMAAAASESARRFSPPAFATAVQRLVAEVTTPSST